MVVICLACLFPLGVGLASVFSQPTIGMTGVNDSNLTVGMTGVSNNDILIDFDAADWHINPSEYPILLIIPTVFFGVALFLIVSFALSEDKSIKNLIIAGILITVALAMLAGVQASTDTLLGG